MCGYVPTNPHPTIVFDPTLAAPNTLVPDLVAAGLGSINISLDTTSSKKFAEITRRNAMPALLKSLRMSREVTDRIKVNCVVMKGFNDGVEDFEGMLEFGRSLDVDVRFIEYMPFNSNEWSETSK